MKVTGTRETNMFRPVTLTVTLETPEEAATLLRLAGRLKTIERYRLASSPLLEGLREQEVALMDSLADHVRKLTNDTSDTDEEF